LIVFKAGTDETKALETLTVSVKEKENQHEICLIKKYQIQEIKPVETVSRTLALIKPDAMQANNKNAILEIIKGNGFNIVQERELQLSREKAGLFYKEHEGKPFYEDLTRWMSR
jgi:acetolactate synthase small subunit